MFAKSVLDLALLSAELNELGGYGIVRCEREEYRDSIRFHSRLPDGSLAGNFAGTYGTDRRGALEYIEHAKQIVKIGRADECPCGQKQVYKS